MTATGLASVVTATPDVEPACGLWGRGVWGTTALGRGAWGRGAWGKGARRFGTSKGAGDVSVSHGLGSGRPCWARSAGAAGPCPEGQLSLAFRWTEPDKAEKPDHMAPINEIAPARNTTTPDQ